MPPITVSSSHGLLPVLLALIVSLFMANPSFSQPMGGAATTESNCRFGMVKDETSRTCQIPIPFGCTVANFPGSAKPWASVSKGGITTCRFDEQHTDWKTRITGACGTCKTRQCSAEFSVKFTCSSQTGPTPYTPQTPKR